MLNSCHCRHSDTAGIQMHRAGEEEKKKKIYIYKYIKKKSQGMSCSRDRSLLGESPRTNSLRGHPCWPVAPQHLNHRPPPTFTQCMHYQIATDASSSSLHWICILKKIVKKKRMFSDNEDVLLLKLIEQNFETCFVVCWIHFELRSMMWSLLPVLRVKGLLTLMCRLHWVPWERKKERQNKTRERLGAPVK